MQVHKGSLAWHNFTRTYSDYDWRLKEGIFETVSKELSNRGLKVIDLAASGVSVFNLNGLLTRDANGAWQPSDSKKALVAKLKGDLGLKAVVSVTELPTALNLPNYPVYDASGIYSNKVWPLDTSFIATAPLWWNVWMLQPMEELTPSNANSRVAAGYYNFPRTGMTPGGWDNGVKVKDDQNVSAAEFHEFRTVILQSQRDKAARLGDSIGPSKGH